MNSCLYIYLWLRFNASLISIHYTELKFLWPTKAININTYIKLIVIFMNWCFSFSEQTFLLISFVSFWALQSSCGWVNKFMTPEDSFYSVDEQNSLSSMKNEIHKRKLIFLTWDFILQNYYKHFWKVFWGRKSQ